MKKRIFSKLVTLAVTVAILLNISFSLQSHILNESKAAMPIYLRYRHSSYPRNRKKEESRQSLHRLIRLLQKSLSSVQMQVDKPNRENKSGYLSEMPATTIGAHDELVGSE